MQKQYTSGHHRIATWAPIVNAHIFAGPSIISALREAAASTLASLNHSVSTEITAGTPRHSSDGDYYSRSDADTDDDLDLDSPSPDDGGDGTKGKRKDKGKWKGKYRDTGRKRSIVTATTISQYTEPTASQLPVIIPRSVPADDYTSDDDNAAPKPSRPPAVQLSEASLARGLLLLAEMSSAGNLMTGAYTEECVRAARAHRDFVLGFVAQRSLNVEEGDNFLTFTPGVALPPPDEEGDVVMAGDGLGQQYNTPRKLVLERGCDVVIVGRGILKAPDRRAEAERYRLAAWRAYEERIGAASAAGGQVS